MSALRRPKSSAVVEEIFGENDESVMQLRTSPAPASSSSHVEILTRAPAGSESNISLKPTGSSSSSGDSSSNNSNDGASFDFLWQEYEKRVAEMQAYEDNSLEIFPQPGLVIKTRTAPGAGTATGSGDMVARLQASVAAAKKKGGVGASDEDDKTSVKVFVNLCSDPAIAPPSSEDPEDDSEESRLRVPMSCGPLREDTVWILP